MEPTTHTGSYGLMLTVYDLVMFVSIYGHRANYAYSFLWSHGLTVNYIIHYHIIYGHDMVQYVPIYTHFSHNLAIKAARICIQFAQHRSYDFMIRINIFVIIKNRIRENTHILLTTII